MSHYEKAWQAARVRIGAAAQAAGRPTGSVKLVAVSKTFPADAVRSVHASGQRAFGENYVQEAVQKMQALPALEWHLIGPLQSNKTRPAAERFAWVHTLQSEKIARRLSEQRPAALAPLNVLIQVNVSAESTKSGVAPADVLALARDVHQLPGLTLRGIMGIPEPTNDIARQRERFRALRGCFDACREAGMPFDTLSMGMSDNLEAAIAEGATEVRVGSAIFGPRLKGDRST